MTTESKPTGRRRPRRPRNRSGSSERPSRPYRTERAAPAPAAKKKTFWQKILAFFSGTPEPEPAPASRSERKPSRREGGTASAEATAPASPKKERERKPRSSIRRPEAVDVTTPRLYVGNLSFDATESDLFELFNGIGLVQNVEVVSNKHTQRSKGFAFVQMQTVEEAQRAVVELHDKEYMGRKLVVSGAKADDRRPERERTEERAEEPTEASPETVSAELSSQGETPDESPVRD